MTQRSKMQKGGKLIIPSKIWKELNLIEGEEIIFDVKKNILIIIFLKQKLTKSCALIENHFSSMPTDSLSTKERPQIMTNIILDASAFLTLLKNEAGAN